MRPESNFSISAMTFNKEDLPAPFRPINPTRSPSSNENAVFANKSTCPYAKLALLNTNKAMKINLLKVGDIAKNWRILSSTSNFKPSSAHLPDNI